MGYKSDVALVLRKNVYEEVMQEAIKNPDDPRYALLVNSDGSPATNSVQMNYDFAVLTWEWVKWYDGYECVDFIETLRRNNDSYFICIGEENYDIEVELNGEDYDMCSVLYLVREFDVNIKPIHIGKFNLERVMKEDPELGKIIEKWFELSKNEGDKGSCVVGAGFNFDYNGKSYFMSACSPYQGSISWEAHKDDIEMMLIGVGATNIAYNLGNLD